MSGGNGATNWSGPVAIQVLDASHLKARLTDWWPCVTLIEFPLNQEGLITVDGTGPPAHTISQAQALMTNLPNGTVTVSGVSEYPLSILRSILLMALPHGRDPNSSKPDSENEKASLLDEAETPDVTQELRDQ